MRVDIMTACTTVTGTPSCRTYHHGVSELGKCVRCWLTVHEGVLKVSFLRPGCYRGECRAAARCEGQPGAVARGAAAAAALALLSAEHPVL